MKHKYCLFILPLLIFFIPSIVSATNLTPQVNTKDKVYDYADLLTDDEEENLLKKVNDFIESYNIDMVLVTIDDNPYGATDEGTVTFSQDFYYYNGFGLGDTRDGLIVLIDMDNRYPYITTRGQATLVFDDERIEKMHNNAHDYLKSESYYSAFLRYVSDGSSYAKYGVPSSNQYYCVDDNGDVYKCKEAPKTVDWGITVVVATLGSFLIVFIHTRKYKGIKLAVNANQYLDNVIINNKTDQFLTTFTSRVKRNIDSGSSGHGGVSGRSRGSGSTISHGSGGSFGGGGGRHF